MRDAMRAEWTKLRTLPGTGWLLLAIVVATVGISVAAAGTTTCPRACTDDPVQTSLTGIVFGQAAVAVFAVLVLAGENAMLSLTFAAMPKRWTVLGAKTILAGALVAVAGAVGVALSLALSHSLLPSGLPVAGTATVIRAAAGSVLYLMLIAFLSIGIAAAVRESAVAVGIVLGLLYVLPIVATTLSDPHWQRRLHQVSPMSAGLAIQATQNLSALPIKPWAGLGVLALWSLCLFVLGGTVMKRRDL
jgi:ABC-2 type transport system permease protein